MASRIAELMTDGRAIDAALREAFYKAVRRHRQANVDMVFMENGNVVYKSPFEIRIPEDVSDSETASPPPESSSGPGG